MKLTRADWVRLLLLWLGGADLRLTLLAVPPLIPLIHRELNLDEKAVGALVSLPVVLFAVAAVPGALLITRLGVRRALGIGLGTVAVFGALRGFGPTAPVLFAATVLMGIGVAVSQPAFPSLVREWFPARITLATAVFSNGILFGETIPTVLTTPFGVLPAFGGDWRWALASWSAIVLASGAGLVVAAPRRRVAASMPASARWWPSWRQGQVIRIGAVMGMASAVYFATNAYIPDFLEHSGRHNLITPTLALLNGSQLLTAPAVALWDRFLMGRAGFIGSATLMAVAQVGLVLTPGPGVVAWAFVLGFSAALSFIVVLSLPPRLAPPGDVPRMSAAVFTTQYALGFVFPLIAGAIWDATGIAGLAFVPGVIGALTMGWLALRLRVPAG
ncbi:MAG TPA: MFS transporter [Candidatus Dormibacteraeota bacterium]|nr:MFS transporter [Candidatus Dormibacteraeota bacterium]